VRGKLVASSVLVALVAVLCSAASAGVPTRRAESGARIEVKIWTIRYRAHNGRARRAYVVLPSWYGPRNNPPLPLVISPHGRGVSARTNARLWSTLPARGSFAVISPDGAGRRLRGYSWGSYDQISDLARMPQIARLTMRWLQIDTHRIYAIGGSMGGQETLLLLARKPKMLAGAAAFDSVANLALQYRSFPRIPCNKRCRHEQGGSIGKVLQRLAREEIGGTPKTRPAAYAMRSPMTYARAIAASCVPLQLWWSVSDRIVLNQHEQSGALFEKIKRLNPNAPVQAYVGSWSHSVEMQAKRRLPVALAQFGLLGAQSWKLSRGLHFVPPPPPHPCGGERPRPAAQPQTGADGDGAEVVQQAADAPASGSG
jgi:pimeloyl-ACP methyl ester carboxylesterase